MKKQVRKGFLYTTCSEHVFFGEFNEQSLVMLWVNWCKNEGFWKRFTCTTVHSYILYYAHIINVWKKLCALYLAFIQNCSTYFAALVWWTIDRISFLPIKKAAELCHPLLAQNLFHFQHMLQCNVMKIFLKTDTLIMKLSFFGYHRNISVKYFRKKI